MTDWRMDAACRDHDPELFFPASEAAASMRQIHAAKEVCVFECPVREQCLAEAMLVMPQGIWGGTTETEWRALVRRGRRDAARASAADEVAIARGLADKHAARSLDERDKTTVMETLHAEGVAPHLIASRVGCGTARVRRVLGVDQ